MTAPADQHALREALARWLKDANPSWFDTTCADLADALIAGPLAPYLAAEAENTRLKETVEAAREALVPFAKLSFSFDGFSFDPAEMVVLGRCCGTFQPNEHAHLERAIDAARSVLATIPPKENPDA